LSVPDPVSWKVVERGWRVVDAEGEEIGRVHEITGDENADIFDGLAINEGLFTGNRYVPAESVGEIVPGEVHLTLTRSQVDALGDFTEPAPEEEVLDESSTWYQRFAWRWLAGRKR
jgi:hypothetical protein